MANQKAVQRSFRISSRTAQLLDQAAAEGTESRNALVDRLLGEAVRTERHPHVRFHPGAAGRRRPLVLGTRLYVHQVMATLRGHGGDVEATAQYFEIDPQLVRAALSYYADHTDEVDADGADSDRAEALERARWERQQQALG